jgi:gliding motility associated protien GldN
MSFKELMASVEKADSMQLQRPYPPYDFYDTVIFKKMNNTDVKKLRIKEDWFFDKQRSMLEVRIIGICPVVDVFNDDGSYRGQKPLFWIYFPEARTLFAKAEVFNRFNGAARLTYDDFFWKRMFSSYIYKVDNQYDRKIMEYATGIDAILESERIKEELFNFEQQLWEY